MKAHDNNPGNELADLLAKEATCDNSLQTTYHKYSKSAVTNELNCLGIQKWQREWDNTNNGAVIKTFFPADKREANQTNTNEPKIIDDSNWARKIKVLSVEI